jgi:hypothetical protein
MLRHFSKFNYFFWNSAVSEGQSAASSPMLAKYTAGAIHFVTVAIFIFTTEVRYWLSF